MSQDNADLKDLAISVQGAARTLGYKMPLGHAQEVIARTGGLANWMAVVALRRAPGKHAGLALQYGDGESTRSHAKVTLAFLVEQLHEHVSQVQASQEWSDYLSMLEDNLCEALGLPSRTGVHEPNLRALVQALSSLREHVMESTAWFDQFDYLLRMIREAAHPLMMGQKIYQPPGSNVLDPLTGRTVQWDIEFLSDRWGDLDEDVPDYEDDPKRKASLDAIWGRDEMGFLARKDGKLGILVEAEYASIESESKHDKEAAAQYQPHAQVVQAIRECLVRIAQTYPGVQVGIPPAEQICNDRPAAWVFFDEQSMTPEQRVALGRELMAL